MTYDGKYFFEHVSFIFSNHELVLKKTMFAVNTIPLPNPIQWIKERVKVGFIEFLPVFEFMKVQRVKTFHRILVK